jgi:hypothetical protein
MTSKVQHRLAKVPQVIREWIEEEKKVELFLQELLLTI